MIDKQCEHGGDNFHISNLFFVDFGSSSEKHDYKQPDPSYTADTILSNGFMYIAKKTNDNISSNWKVDGVKIGVGDAVIINCRSESELGLNGKAIKYLTSADVDIIDAQDEEFVTKELLNEVSSFLSNSLELSVGNLSIDINDLSTNLVLSVGILSNDINDLGTNLELSVDILSNAISSKIYIENAKDGVVGHSDLSIIKIDKDEYDMLVATNGSALCGNVLYVVDSDYIDAYGQVISNVVMSPAGIPEKASNPSEAANKNYVDAISAIVTTNILDKIDVVQTNLNEKLELSVGNLSTSIDDLSDHYSKTFVEDTYYKQGRTEKVDVLKVVNPNNIDDTFKLIYLSGTLVLQSL